MKIISRSSAPRRVQRYTPVNSLMDDFFRTPSLLDEFFNSQLSTASVAADVWEENDEIMISMALPGVKKDDVEIEINADRVTIKGHTKDEEELDENKKYYFRSMESSFEQSFNLPTVVDADGAEAGFEDGVLTVRLPKSEQYKPKQIKVS